MREMTRVAVVNDTAAIAELIEELLSTDRKLVPSQLLHEPTVDEIAATEPDLIFLGLRTNGRLHGFGVVAAIRSHDQIADVPIVLCTGDLRALRDRQDELDRDPRTHVLVKPFDLETFDNLMARVLDA